MVEKKLIVRMKPEDIINGATDLSLYQYCKENNWTLYFKLDLHAKTYVFDNVRCIVGSANATASGLSVGGLGNYEMAASNILDKDDKKALAQLINSSILMTEHIYNLMKSTIETYDKLKEPRSIKWPTEINRLKKLDFSVLFVEDFPNVNSPCIMDKSEYNFLGDVSELSLTEIRDIFSETKCYLWLKDVLTKHENHELYFGEASVLLHNVLLNDPKPYRKEVKELLGNLLRWIEILKCEEICVDRPNHSQRIRVIT